jgi:very-short-patch-repair endonuclease
MRRHGQVSAGNILHAPAEKQKMTNANKNNRKRAKQRRMAASAAHIVVWASSCENLLANSGD